MFLPIHLVPLDGLLGFRQVEMEEVDVSAYLFDNPPVDLDSAWTLQEQMVRQKRKLVFPREEAALQNTAAMTPELGLECFFVHNSSAVYAYLLMMVADHKSAMVYVSCRQIVMGADLSPCCC